MLKLVGGLAHYIYFLVLIYLGRERVNQENLVAWLIGRVQGKLPQSRIDVLTLRRLSNLHRYRGR